MKRTRASVAQVASLRPELEFEIIKQILLRESYVQRLKKRLQSPSNSVDMSIIGFFDVLRDVSIEIVETIQDWERSQVNYPSVKPFMWNGIEYLDKMLEDLGFLDGYSDVTAQLGFSAYRNPFLIPVEVFSQSFSMRDNSFVVFGERPPPPSQKGDKLTTPFFKSPYNTPIVNDTQLVPSSSSIRAKKELEMKAKADKRKAQGKITSQRKEDDPYQTFLPSDVISKIRKCWKILCRRDPGASSTFDQSGSTFGMGGESKLSFILEDDETIPYSPSTTSVDTLNVGDFNATNKSAAQFGSSLAGSGVVMDRPNQELRLAEVGENIEKDYTVLEKHGLSTTFSSTSEKPPPLHPSQALASHVDKMDKLATTISASKKVQIWTPHDVVLQQVVHRRGGELFALTAAGTKGRATAPYRKSRLERLKTDIDHLGEQSNLLTMTLEDISNKCRFMSAAPAPLTPDADYTEEKDSGVVEGEKVDNEKVMVEIEESRTGIEQQISFLSYQLKHFQKVMEPKNNVLDVDYQRKLKNLKSGQPLESEQYLALSLEDSSAAIIQRYIRKVFGKMLRRALIQKRHYFATKIQLIFRQYSKRKLAASVAIRTKLALLLQKQYRTARSENQIQMLVRDKAVRFATRLLQRVYRGHLGRVRAKKKVSYVHHLHDCKQSVGMGRITPADVENLADEIDFFMKDYMIDLPLTVMTVLRAVMYMFNQANPEIVSVNNNGFIEKKKVYADECSWSTIQLILRRKGRFLRRLRSMVSAICPPNAELLEWDENTQIHLDALIKTVSEKDFESMKLGKKCIIQIYRFVYNVKVIYDSQALFPEVYVKSLPHSFRKLLGLRSHFEDADIAHKVAVHCSEQVALYRESYTKAGLKWKAVANATYKCTENEALTNKNLVHKKRLLDYFINKLDTDSAKKLELLRGLERSRQLGADVAKRDLDSYLSSGLLNINEDQVKFLQHTLDEKLILLLENQSSLVSTLTSMQNDVECRAFEDFIKYEHIHKHCRMLGQTIGDLLVLQENWQEFLVIIGGAQFLVDLVGDDLKNYRRIQKKAVMLMERRQMLKARIKKEIKAEVENVRKYAQNAMIITHWDYCSKVVIDAEIVEDLECARRDADVEIKQRRATDNVTINYAHHQPHVVIIDQNIPRRSREIIVKRFCSFQFKLCEKDQCDPMLCDEIQGFFDDGYNALLFVDRGLHANARSYFVTRFEATIGCLIPIPKVVAVDSSQSFLFDNWHSMFSCEFENCRSFDASNSRFCTMTLGKIRRIASALRICMFNPKIPIVVNMKENWKKRDDLSMFSHGFSSAFPSWLRGVLVQNVIDFQNDLAFGGVVSSHCEEKMDGDEFSTLSSLERSGMVLAATITSMLDMWTAPLLKWKEDDISYGCFVFVELLKDEEAFCSALELKVMPKFDTLKAKRLDRARELVSVWRAESELDFYEYPFRHLLACWCLETFDLMDAMIVEGGPVVEGAVLQQSSKHSKNTFIRESIKHTRIFDWPVDTYSYACEKLIGDVLTEVWHDVKVFDSEKCPVVIFEDRQNIHSLEDQAVGVVPGVRHVRVYHIGDDAFIGMKSSKDIFVNGMRQEKTWWTYCRMSLQDEFASMLRPNSTEMFQGEMKKAIDFIDGKKVTEWYEILATWLTLDDIGAEFVISPIRNRSVLLSKLGVVDGYPCRMEIFEERFGEVLFLIHGLPSNGALKLFVGKELMCQLIEVCDYTEEREKLEILEAKTLAAVYADRLTITPNKKWLEFLMEGDLPLCEKTEERLCTLKVKMHLKRGPGRHVGKVLITLHGIKLLVSIFEIHHESDMHGLRILLYEFKHSQTVEYRLSPMERSSLFVDEKPLLDQVVSRIRAVYCVMNEPHRVLIKLDPDFVPHIVPWHPTDESETQYNIRTGDPPIPEGSDSDSDSGSGSESGSDDGDKSVESLDASDADGDDSEGNGGSDDESVSQFESLAQSIGSSKSNVTDEDDDGHSCGHSVTSAALDLIDKLSQQGSTHHAGTANVGIDTIQSVTEDDFTLSDEESEEDSRPSTTMKSTTAKNTPEWGWAITFNRTMIDEPKSNFVVSVGLCLPLEGFFILAFDLTTYYEAYLFLSFKDACNIFYDKELKELKSELRSVDESVAYDLIDEIITCVDFTEDDDGNQRLSVVSEKDEDKYSMIITHLTERELGGDTPVESQVPLDIEIRILEAKNLARSDMVGSSDPFCIVKWNGVDFGHTKVIPDCLNPVWHSEFFEYHIEVGANYKSIAHSRLDIEIYDMNRLGSSVFLGKITLENEELQEFINEHESTWMDLERMDEKDVYDKGGIAGFLKRKRPTVADITGEIRFSGNMTKTTAAAQTMKIASSRQMGHRGIPESESFSSVDGSSIDSGDFICNIASFDIHVMEIEKLPKAVSVFVLIKVNGYEIGRTKTSKPDKSPHFTEETSQFEIVIPPKQELAGCAVSIEVWEEDSSYHFTIGSTVKPHFYGGVVLRGSELEQFIYDRGAEFSWYPLEASEEVDKEHHVGTLRGRIKIIGTHNVQDPPNVSEVGIVLPDSSAMGSAEVFEAGGESAEIVLDEQLPLVASSLTKTTQPTKGLTHDPTKNERQKAYVVSPLAQVQDLNRQKLTLNVVCCKGLSKANTFASSNPGAEVWFNCQYIGKTKIINNDINPYWGEDVCFDLYIPRGQYINGCVLEVLVYDFDSSGKRGKFLGGRVIKGIDMVHLSGLPSCMGNSLDVPTGDPAIRPKTVDSVHHQDHHTYHHHEQNDLVAKPKAHGHGGSRPHTGDTGELKHSFHAELHSTVGHSVPSRPCTSDTTHSHGPPQVVANRTKEDESVVLELHQSKRHSVEENKLVKGHIELKLYGDFDPNSVCSTQMLGGRPVGHNEEGLLLPMPLQLSSVSIKGFVFVHSLVAPAAATAKSRLHSAPAQPVTTVVEEKYNAYYVVVLWNGQRIGRTRETVLSTNSVSQSPGPKRNSSIAMTDLSWGVDFPIVFYVPPGYRINHCFLELQLWNVNSSVAQRKTDMIIGTKQFHGNLLTNLFHKRVAPAACHQMIKHSVSSTTRTNKDDDNFVVSGSFAICGKFKTMAKGQHVHHHHHDDDLVEEEAYHIIPNSHYHTIGTDLEEKNTDWRHVFDTTETVVDHQSVGTTLYDAVSNAEIMVINGDTEGVSVFAADKRSISNKYLMELPAIYYIDSEALAKEACRIRWRGMVTPKNVMFKEGKKPESEAAKTTPKMQRTSKLHITKSMNEIQVVSEVKHIIVKQDTTAVQYGNELPICVKEVVSDGPGVLTRLYRVEVLMHSGVEIGHDDIQSNEELASVLGAKSTFKSDGATLDPNAFEYIAKERLVLNMLPNERKVRADGRREGMRQASGSESKYGGKVVALERDTLEEIKKAKEGMNVIEEHDSDSDESVAKPVRRRTFAMWEERQKKKLLKAAAIREGSGSEGSGSDSSDSDSDSDDSFENRFHSLRICQRTHKMSGRTFRSLIMLQSRDQDITENTDHFFQPLPVKTTSAKEIKANSLEIFKDVMVRFKSRDAVTKENTVFDVLGRDMCHWLPTDFEFDLSKEFRRAKFGEFLLVSLVMRYTLLGDFHLDLLQRKPNPYLVNGDEMLQPLDEEEDDF